MTPVRVLVVENFIPFREFISLTLARMRNSQVIGEVSDGLEAVQKARELQPDLILMDIGLPTLNGIEAARRIRQISPNSKIIFLSLHNSPDMVQAALRTGALGYVWKKDALQELLPAVDTVLRGKHYVSSSLVGDTPAKKVPRRHEVLFYAEDTVLLDGFTRPIAAALKVGNAAIVLATKSHRDSLLQRLKAEGVDTDGALQQGTYISLDAADTLSKIMINGLPDPVRFFEGIGGFIEAAAKAVKLEQAQVVVCGEAVALLHAEGNADAAIRFEQLGNDLARTREVNILCAYPLSNFQDEEDEQVFQSICAEHSAVVSQ